MTKTIVKETTYTLTEEELRSAVLAYMERDGEAQKEIYDGETKVDFIVKTSGYDAGTGHPKAQVKGVKVVIKREE